MLMSRSLLVLALVALVIPVHGQVAAKPAATTTEPAPQDRYETGVVAIVNRDVITRGEVNAEMEDAALGAPEARREELFRNTLVGMIEDRVMEHAAKRMQLILNPQQILAHVERQKWDLGSEEAYTKYLTEQGMTHEEYVDDITAATQRHLYIQSFAGARGAIGDVLRPEHSVEPTAREIRAHYEKHFEEEYREVAKADIWYMAITTASTGTSERAGTKELALARARMIKEQLETGADFATLARKYSATNAEDGGHAGWKDRSSSLLKPILDYAFTGEVGKISDPIEFRTGWLLVLCAERKEAAEKPFAEAQREIGAEIRSLRIARAKAAVRARIVKDAYIHPEEYKTVLVKSLEAGARGGR